MTDRQISAYVAHGFRRWTKGNLDRLYINARELGLFCEFYHTGNVKYAEFCGEQISNSEARRILGAKTYVDANTGKIFSDYTVTRERVTMIVAEIENELKGDCNANQD